MAYEIPPNAATPGTTPPTTEPPIVSRKFPLLHQSPDPRLKPGCCTSFCHFVNTLITLVLLVLGVAGTISMIEYDGIVREYDNAVFDWTATYRDEFALVEFHFTQGTPAKSGLFSPNDDYGIDPDGDHDGSHCLQSYPPWESSDYETLYYMFEPWGKADKFPLNQVPLSTTITLRADGDVFEGSVLKDFPITFSEEYDEDTVSYDYNCYDTADWCCEKDFYGVWDSEAATCTIKYFAAGGCVVISITDGTVQLVGGCGDQGTTADGYSCPWSADSISSVTYMSGEADYLSSYVGCGAEREDECLFDSGPWFVVRHARDPLLVWAELCPSGCDPWVGSWFVVILFFVVSLGFFFVVKGNRKKVLDRAKRNWFLFQGSGVAMPQGAVAVSQALGPPGVTTQGAGAGAGPDEPPPYSESPKSLEYVPPPAGYVVLAPPEYVPPE